MKPDPEYIALRNTFVPVAEEIANELIGKRHPPNKKGGYHNEDNEAYCNRWNLIYCRAMDILIAIKEAEQDEEDARREADEIIADCAERIKKGNEDLQRLRTFKPIAQACGGAGKQEGKS